MHLLQAQSGEAADAAEPVDPAQDPADLVFLSAADTEIAALAEARAGLGAEAPELRLAQLGWLTHPFSVDLYLDKTALGARFVIARILGGEAYWRYGLEQFSARLNAAGIAFAALPGDDKPDDALFRASTVDHETWTALWSYCVEGGPENAANLLRYAAWAIGPRRPEDAPPAAKPLLKAGLYWPGVAAADLDAVRRAWRPGAPTTALVFYRALIQGGGLQPINRLIEALAAEGQNPLPLFVASLKDPVSAATLSETFAAAPPDLVLNATGFSVGAAGSTPAPGGASPGSQGLCGADAPATPLDAPSGPDGRRPPVLQLVLASGAADAWRAGDRGLSPRDIAMNVALPEVDGRILTRAIAFKAEAYRDAACQCPITAHRAEDDRVAFVARLAAAWTRLARKRPAERRVALVLANYPSRDGRLGNGVGLDAPASAAAVLDALREGGYRVEQAPADGAALMARILAGPTNRLADRSARDGGARLTLGAYREAYAALPAAARERIEARWGPPEADPYLDRDRAAFVLSILSFGGVALGVQPSRGYDVDPSETYHCPDLPPPHHYLAFYIWLRRRFEADAIVHLGKHGNLEWLPGKALALSEACLPEAAFGPTPHFYPFIVNDPGEGTQAKRRAQAAIIDHLTPPMTRAESYGPLKDLEALVDEYYEASGVDPRRSAHLRAEILSLTENGGLDLDAGLDPEDDADARLRKLDAYLCELKESQIRDGLHVFGRSPEGRLETDLLAALVRVPRGSRDEDASLLRALAADLLPAAAFDPLDADLAAPWTGPRPAVLQNAADAPWRSAGDAVERLELLSAELLSGARAPEPGWAHVRAVMSAVETDLRPRLRASGPSEIAGLLAGLDGRFVPPGPSGAPTRGRPDVLPTGRNFYSVDTRAVPTPAAWALGWRSASLLIERHLQDQGDWLRAAVLTAWGTAQMRTGGDDVAQALALMGARPVWEPASRRVTGFEILPLSALGRPRVDVTLRVSGFFRDAFPSLIALVDQTARAVMALDEPADQNPAAAAFRAAGGDRAAGARVFSSKPGAYGAGLQALIDSGVWRARADLAEAYLAWGGYAYGADADGWGAPARDRLAARLAGAEAVIQNQGNREDDLLDSGDIYQFEGGAAAAVALLSGREPASYHLDHSRPERPAARTLAEEIGRVVRARVVNPKWIAGVRRHGYKGAFEIAATVDYLFAFAATTRAVRPHHFDLAAAAYLEDDAVRGFIAEANPAALREIADRFQEAIERRLWSPKSNRVPGLLAALRAGAAEGDAE